MQKGNPKTVPATILYTVGGKERAKSIRIPAQRHGYGIYRQGDGYVQLSGFKKNPQTHGYGKPNFIDKYVKLPANAGTARLKVGNRVISKAP